MVERVRAKKSLGQHFLTHHPTAERIVASLSEESTGPVLEVGPGMGILTGYLLERFGERLWVVEIDSESVAYLNDSFPSLKSRIIHQDFLRTDVTDFFKGSFSVIGNFPYNISSQILFHLLEVRQDVIEIVGMFQREVGRRLVSDEGSKEYGILSVLMGSFFSREYLFTVNEQQFRPPPRVKSGVVRFRRSPEKDPDTDPKLLFRVVKAAFNQRRKTLRNALHAFPLEQVPTRFLPLRAEQLRVEDFAELTRSIQAGTQVTGGTFKKF